MKAALASLLLFLCLAAPVDAGQRVALVIGNGAYENATPLKNPGADARAVAEKLEALGFETHAALDATQAGLLGVISDFIDALDGAEAALFYYSGHGLQLGDENYLLPVDISVENELSVRYGAVAISDILADMERRTEANIVVLDACRDNPFAEELRRATGATRSLGASRGLARMSPSASGTIIAYAAAAGAVAADGDGEHSPYTEALLQEIDRPGAEVGLIFRRVAGRVVEATGGDQRPELLVRLTSEFYFSAPQAVEVAAVAPHAVAPGAADPGAEPQAVPQVTPGAAEPAGADASAPDAGQAPTQSAGAVASAVPGAPTRNTTAPARWGYYAALATPEIDPPRTPWRPEPGTAVAESAGSDTIAYAQRVGAGDTVRLSIHPRGDRDFLAVDVGQAGMITLSATGLPAEIDLAARILNGDLGTVVGWTSAPRPGGDFHLAGDLPAPGSYVIDLADGGSDAEAAAPIDLALAFSPSPDLYEPNDTIGEARAVPIADSRTAAILPQGDADWFTVSTEVPGELVIEALDVPEELDIAVRVLDSDDATVLGWTTAPRPGGDTYAVADLARPGSYSIEVRDGANNARSERGFTLRSSFTASVDQSEPNDNIGAAYEVPQSGALPLTIFPLGDADWLAVTVDQPGQLELTARQVSEDLDVAFRVLDADQATVLGWTAAPRPGGETYGLADLARPGRYLIEVRDGANNQRSIEPFELETRFTPAPDQYEPNNTIGTARHLTPGGAVALNILPVGDADWFRLGVDTPGALAIAIDEGPKDLDIHFRVLNADRATVVGWTAPYAPGGLTEAVADLPLPGTYYIEVRDGGNNQRSVEHATLSTAFTPLVASYEPNDSRARATAIPLAGETWLHILPVGDGDMFRVWVDRPGRLDIEIDEVPAALDVAFRVLDAAGSTVTGWTSAPRPGGVTTGEASFAVPGEYYIELRDGGNDARDPSPFRLRRTFHPAG